MALYDNPQVQRIRYGVESTFGADLTSDVASNFHDIRHKPTRFKPGDLMEADSTVRQSFYDQRNDVRGPARASISVECYFVPSDEAITNAVSPTESTQTRLMGAILGGKSAEDSGSAVAASPSPTTTGFSVGSGHGSNFSEGQIASVVISGVSYPFVVTDVSTDALTVWPALPSAPSSTAVVHNSQYVYLDETNESSLQWLTETAIDRGNLWLLKGCQGDLQFDLQRNGTLGFTTNQNVAEYVHDDEITTPQGGSAIGFATYDAEPIWGTEGGVILTPTSGSTRTLVRCVEFSLSLGGPKWIEAGDYAGTEGLGQWVQDIPRIMVELTILKNGSDGTWELYHDAFRAETDYGVLWWVGTAAGSGLAISAPTCQIAAPPEPVVWQNGIEAIKLSLLVKRNTKTGATTTALQRSPVVIAQF